MPNHRAPEPTPEPASASAPEAYAVADGTGDIPAVTVRIESWLGNVPQQDIYVVLRREDLVRYTFGASAQLRRYIDEAANELIMSLAPQLEKVIKQEEGTHAPPVHYPRPAVGPILGAELHGHDAGQGVGWAFRAGDAEVGGDPGSGAPAA